MKAQQEPAEESRFKARIGPVEFDVPSRAAPMILVIGLLFLLLVLFFPAQSKAIFTMIQGLVSRSVTVPGGTDPGAGRTPPPAGPGTSGSGGSSGTNPGGSSGGSDTPQPLSPADSITALRSINVDFSVQPNDLKKWLDNPHSTSYPAISSELLALVRGRKLRDLVYIDVIVFNYEHTPGVKLPRTASDVRVDVLKMAVLEGYNERYGTSESSFDAIVT